MAALVSGALGLIAGAFLGPRWLERTGADAATSAHTRPTNASRAGDAAPTPGAPDATGEERVIRRGPLTDPYPTQIDAATLDVDGDGTEETVELFAAVERDARGRPMWDDGQRWMLRVREDAAPEGYVLFDDFVQLGRLSFWAVTQPERPAALVLEVAAGAGVRVWSVRYDPARDGFVEGPSVAASGNVVHRTPAEP